MMTTQHATHTSLLAILLLVVANVLIPLSVAIFAKGFFPYKPLLPGLAQYVDLGYGPPAPAPFDRVILMMVDALRSDFVYATNSGFEFTQSLIRSGEAVPFTAHASSPTVTMPRIKAITTGSTPSFLDVVLNVDEGDKSSSLASQDTWLAQMKAKASGKLVLYGDDTWLKLFPETFDRADGTTSFFVSDFTEVDRNVTRHVAGELARDDWSVLVLHYLGLDHIGHKGGPRSPNMVPKQREMDGIVRAIHEALASQPHLASTLLVLAGDHGMNEAGNHGASSAGETSAALLFVAPKLQAALGGSRAREAPLDERDDFRFYQTVEQSDLAPTLAALLGFPAPRNNIGALIPDFLPLWPQRRDQAHILLQNAHQMLDVLEAAFGRAPFEAAAADDCSSLPSDVEELGCVWQAIVRSAPGPEGGDLDGQWTALIIKWLRHAQNTMSGMASDYDLPKLWLGLTAAVASTILAIASSIRLASGYSSSSSSGSIAAMGPFAAVLTAYGVMMFASSYVEEEHHFWYWATTAWVAIAGLRSLSLSLQPSMPAGGRPGWRRGLPAAVAVVAALTAVRLVRAWNQTGQKFAGAPDVAKTFLQPQPLLLWTLVGATYALIGWQLACGLSSLSAPTAAAVPGVALLVVAAFSFKLVFTLEDSPELVGSFVRPLAEFFRSTAGGGASLVARARAVFVGLAVAALAVVSLAATAGRRVPSRGSGQTRPRAPVAESLLRIYSLLAVTQSRAVSIPLFLLFDVVFRFLARQQTGQRGGAGLAAAELTTVTLLLQSASFFALGGTNAISSVDLSSAYNGITGFSAPAVGVLLFVGNWAAPIYWSLAGVVLLLQRQLQPPRSDSLLWVRHVALLTVFAAGSTAAVMAACAALRTHLFVWTVFSPKYLYCAAWSLGMHLGINIGLGGLLYALGKAGSGISQK